MPLLTALTANKFSSSKYSTILGCIQMDAALSCFSNFCKGVFSVNLLSTALRGLPEYRSLLQGMDAPSASAITGLSSIHRAHMAAALRQDTGRPILIVCQDDLAASRMTQELSGFLGRNSSAFSHSRTGADWRRLRLARLGTETTGNAPSFNPPGLPGNGHLY